MAITNKLVVEYDYDLVDRDFDFYEIATTDKYIPRGAYILDKPNCEFKAESVVFDDHTTLYVMFRKSTVSRMRLVKMIDDDKLMVNTLQASRLKTYILFRLFLFALNNYENQELSFNNITGKLYICRPDWMAKNKKTFTALGINVDSEMNIVAEAVTFSLLSNFKNVKKFKDYPKYIFSNKNCALKRVASDDYGQEVYIKRTSFNKKSVFPYFEFAPKSLKNNKMYYIYDVLAIMSQKYGQYFSFKFDEIEIAKSIGHFRDEHFMDKALSQFKNYKLNFVNFVKGAEFSNDFDDMVNRIVEGRNSNYHISSHISADECNIALIHNEDYYLDNDYADPYKSFDRKSIIQCVSIEDSAYKIIEEKTAIIDTIIKEVVIKHDIINTKHISLDDWESFNFASDWIFGRACDNRVYFLTVHPDGMFEFLTKQNNFDSFNSDILDDCANILFDDNQEKYVVSNGKDIILITKTNRYILPSSELFTLETISRSKQSREKYLSGVVDINLFKLKDNQSFYNVGIKGSGMYTSIPHAPLLYKVEIIAGRNIIEDILGLMSATFVKYKSFTVIPYPFKYLNEFILMKREYSSEEK